MRLVGTIGYEKEIICLYRESGRNNLSAMIEGSDNGIKWIFFY